MNAKIFLLFSFVEVTVSRDTFQVCTAPNLKVTQSFEASRLAASIFPCFVSEVFLKYRPPTEVLLISYKPLCFSLRVCYGVNPANRVTNHEEFKTMSKCFTEIWMTFAAMDIAKYYKVAPELLESVDEKHVRSFLSGVVECYAALDVESFRITSDIAVASLKWIMKRLF